MEPATKDLTLLLNRAADGSRSAADQLLPLVYEELRELARINLSKEPAGLTLQATALVHEAFLRLGADPDARWDGRPHYYAAAAIAMRRILVERARSHAGPRRGGGWGRVHLEEVDAATASQTPIDWLALDEALVALEARDPQLAELVLLRYFAGLNIDQTAAALGASPRTIDRDWKVARAFLQHHIARAGNRPS